MGYFVPEDIKNRFNGLSNYSLVIPEENGIEQQLIRAVPHASEVRVIHEHNYISSADSVHQ